MQKNTPSKKMGTLIFTLISILISGVGHTGIYLMHSIHSSLRIEGVGAQGWIWLIPSLSAAFASMLFSDEVMKSLDFSGLKGWRIFKGYFICAMGLLSLSGAIFVMSVHCGARTAVSPLDHPSYPIAILGSTAMVIAGLLIRDPEKSVEP